MASLISTDWESAPLIASPSSLIKILSLSSICTRGLLLPILLISLSSGQFSISSLSSKMIPLTMAGRFKLAFGALLRSLHQLWLEVTGAFLLLFAGVFAYYGIKEYRKFPEFTAANLWEIGVALGLSVLTFGFGIHSFWKARKLR